MDFCSVIRFGVLLSPDHTPSPCRHGRPEYHRAELLEKSNSSKPKLPQTPLNLWPGPGLAISGWAAESSQLIGNCHSADFPWKSSVAAADTSVPSAAKGREGHAHQKLRSSAEWCVDVEDDDDDECRRRNLLNSIIWIYRFDWWTWTCYMTDRGAAIQF